MNQNAPNICQQLEYFLFNTFIEKSNDIIMITDDAGGFNNACILGINSSFELTTGFTQKQLINTPCAEWINISVNQLHRLNTAFKHGTSVQLELAVKNNEDDFVLLQFDICPVKLATKFWIWQCKPLSTEQYTGYDQPLIQQNEMQGMQQIAGQTAHDFNNILAVIMGNNDLALENIETSSPFYPLFQSISRAIDKGTNLTKTLLVFAQRHLLTSVELELNDYVSCLANRLRERLGLHYDLQLKLAVQPCDICVDPELLEECITNLVLNAAQAMLEKSTVIIEVNKVFMQQQKDAFEQMIIPQEYVNLTITDTGKGITTSNLPLIFTPFFTTQKMNAAKGLGLSLVYGFLKKSKGYCLVDTEVGKGSTFSLLFRIPPHHPII